ncbi:RseA family anti-sigma factor [uncultured Photobacterium sp.]|uniref:RseA family anti-sigma factor n=1 Tax=uncultured Photobacterium sp. TaxID=173973 RepID=UPI0026028DF4|nr:RseA family anti-sigma factor [uncultured Photobacterium sp.]
MADKEKISALLDGEDLDQSIINALTVDKDSEQSWYDFSLIGDVMRGDAPQCIEWNIAGNVALALEAEPAHTGAVIAHIEMVTQPMITEEQPTPFKAKRTLPAWLSQFGQVAVAACVSLAVIVGVQQYDGNGNNFTTATSNDVPVLQTIPFTGKAEPVSLNTSMVDNNQTPSESQLMEQRRRINSMLQDYELQLRFNAEDGSIDHSRLHPNNSVAD